MQSLFLVTMCMNRHSFHPDLLRGLVFSCAKFKRGLNLGQCPTDISFEFLGQYCGKDRSVAKKETMKIVFDILMAQLLGNKRDAAACVYFFLPPKVGILSYSIFILRFMSQCYHICVLHLQMKDSSFPKPFQRGRFPYSYYWIDPKNPRMTSLKALNLSANISGLNLTYIFI